MERRCELCEWWRCEPGDYGLGWCEHPIVHCVARSADESCGEFTPKGELHSPKEKPPVDDE